MTSQMMLNFYMAMMLYMAMFLMGLVKNNLQFVKLFIPECPFLLLFLLVPMEIFSYMMSVFSLAMSLGANMMAGHTLVYLLASLILLLVKIKNIFMVLMMGILVLFVLEFCVAFLQAYVFVILLCIYMKDSMS